MVVRAATVCLLVVVLLACPYPCLMHAAVGLGNSATEPCQADDDCCGSPGSETGKDHSGAPAPCSQGGTCLCHGAVMERHVAPPALDCEIVTFLPHDAGTRDRGCGRQRAGFRHRTGRVSLCCR